VPIVGGIDIHRAQLTFDYVDLNSGEVVRGRGAGRQRADPAAADEPARPP
jgi:hypothetical protein